MRIGIDLLTIGELDRLADRPWFIRYAFADAELARASAFGPPRRQEFLAGRFAAKEAVLKVLGRGMFDGVIPRDIALLRLPGGAPHVQLSGSAARAADAAGIARITVSITHKRDLAVAVAVGYPARADPSADPDPRSFPGELHDRPFRK